MPNSDRNRSAAPGMTSPRRLVLLLAAGLLAPVGCAAPGSPLPASPEATASTGTETAGTTFTIQGYRFGELVVAPGAAVTVIDGDDEPHTVTADDGSFDTGSFDASHPGFFVAPATPGDHPVHCAIHPSMHGTLTVR